MAMKTLFKNTFLAVALVSVAAVLSAHGITSYFVRFSVPPTCNADSASRNYYDTDDNLAYLCNGTIWTPILVSGGGAATVGIPTTLLTNAVDAANSIWGSSGQLNFEGTTADTKENYISSSETAEVGLIQVVLDDVDLATIFSFKERPLVGTGGSVLEIAFNLLAANGSDTINGIYFSIVNADHTGVSNQLNAVMVESITGDADAVESAFRAGDGWDFLLASLDPTINIGWATGGTFNLGEVANAGTPVVRFSTATAAGTVHTQFGAGGSGYLLNPGDTFFKILYYEEALDGSDTDIVLDLNIDGQRGTSSGVSNFLKAIFIEGITAEAAVTETAIGVGAGWDIGLDLSAFAVSFTTSAIKITDSNAIEWTGTTTEGQLVGSTRIYASNLINGQYIVTLETNAGTGGEILFKQSTADIAVVGAAQNVAADSDVHEIGAGAAASVITVSAPGPAGTSQRITFICKDANVTFTDSGAVGAANTIDLAGAADFVCSSDDTLTLAFGLSLGAGNNRWLEVARSVN